MLSPTLPAEMLFGIIDCNNFFVSCERVFRPRLKGVAVVVLSNNDGCVIARSNEAKAMGIKMGTPYFKVRPLVQRGLLHVCSGNLTLYGDMSRRVMSIVRQHVPQIEVYSIDECFMDLTGIRNVKAFGEDLSALVEKWTGIPVSIGIAPTKTLAKIASKFAKKYPGYRGCCRIETEAQRLKALELTEIGDVWGIGRRIGARLAEAEVRTAADFAAWKETRVRRYFTLPTVQTWRELNGRACLGLETPAAKQSITSSRSFKKPLQDFGQLRAVIVDFAAECAHKLREEGSAAKKVTVFIRTDSFRPDLPQYSNAATVQLDVHTSDVRELAGAAGRALEAIFSDRFAYKKAGVYLSDIAHGVVQGYLFDKVDRQKQARLLQAVDRIHERMGKDALTLASQESVQKVMSHEFRSPCYTTRLSDIIEVKL